MKTKILVSSGILVSLAVACGPEASKEQRSQGEGGPPSGQGGEEPPPGNTDPAFADYGWQHHTVELPFTMGGASSGSTESYVYVGRVIPRPDGKVWLLTAEGPMLWSEDELRYWDGTNMSEWVSGENPSLLQGPDRFVTAAVDPAGALWALSLKNSFYENSPATLWRYLDEKWENMDLAGTYTVYHDFQIDDEGNKWVVDHSLLSTRITLDQLDSSGPGETIEAPSSEYNILVETAGTGFINDYPWVIGQWGRADGTGVDAYLHYYDGSAWVAEPMISWPISTQGGYGSQIPVAWGDAPDDIYFVFEVPWDSPEPERESLRHYSGDQDVEVAELSVTWASHRMVRANQNITWLAGEDKLHFVKNGVVDTLAQPYSTSWTPPGTYAAEMIARFDNDSMQLVLGRL